MNGSRIDDVAVEYPKVDDFLLGKMAGWVLVYVLVSGVYLCHTEVEALSEAHRTCVGLCGSNGFGSKPKDPTCHGYLLCISALFANEP